MRSTNCLVQGELWPEQAQAARACVRREQEEMRALLQRERQHLKQMRMAIHAPVPEQEDRASPVLRKR